ncbi:MAG: putative heme transporter [Miltoncostaeaceae bacterium]|jgi:uncharacterized membrane protein YbhN (UPF0104 family)|nr:putative heme transporter [Miltoncostaeaceae bacterium]
MASGAFARTLGSLGVPERHLTGRRGTLITLAAAVVLTVGVGALIARATEYATVVDSMREADPGWFALAVPGQGLAYTGYVLAYRDAARVDGGPVLPLRRCLEIVVAGFGALVAASSVGGLAVHYWALHRAGAPPHEAVRRVLGLNTIEWAWLGAAAAVASAGLLAAGDAPLGITLPWVIGVPLCMLAAGWVSSPRRAARLTATEGVGRARTLLADAIGGVVYVRRLVTRPHRYWAGVIGFPLYWLGQLVTLYAGLRAFDGHIGAAALVVGYATGYVASALPLPVGGSGGIDAAMTFALSAVGVPLGTALLGVVAYRLFAFWLPLVPALMILPRLRRLNAELPEAHREGEEPGPEALARP